ncbi:SGNH/GDSL hydrolase family protein [Paracoccus ravus]|uniref:SGNH/GDSL hydrolase family protein n=1 Tax=Paracoccus ravus TaxID=2447760 RepID=UPI00106ECB79|nr:SGNH/GDSL hydrolase family protein [Paracoccus ravus]
MRRARRTLVFLLLAGAIATAAAVWAWPKPARPTIPVPSVALAPGEGGTWLDAALVPEQPDLVALPLLVTGRASAGPKGALLQEWPGFHAEARFSGTSVSVRFQDNVNRWRVLLNDGRAGQVEISRPGVTDLRIRGLTAGEYRIRVEKISESSMPTSFGGILIGADAAPLPAPQPAPRLIEFIGDSDTLGFANGAQLRDCSEEEVFSATDTSRSFGPQVAARLGADYRIIARSGIGLLRNFGGASPMARMPGRYPLALPSEPSAARQPEQPADIVVTALGSNDFGSDLTEGEPWPDRASLSRDFGPALLEFLRARVRDNPAAMQVLLAFGEYGSDLIRPHQLAAEALRAEGVRTLLVPLPKLQRTACAWHPSDEDHRMIADWLVDAITR